MSCEVAIERPPQVAAEHGLPSADERTWCLDCYDRREAWVVRCLGEHGVTFRRAVLEGTVSCHSCRAALRVGTHVMSVRYPGPR